VFSFINIGVLMRQLIGADRSYKSADSRARVRNISGVAEVDEILTLCAGEG
jgi:hypothetical protein